MAQPRPGYAFPGPIPQDALDYFRAKDLRVGFDYRDVWGEEHASAFTVAKATQLDVLQDIKDAVDKAVADGRTFEQFKKDLTPILQSKGWWGTQEVVDPLTGENVEARLGSPRRLKVIYDANLRAARAAGQWERIQRTKDALPYLLYCLGPSEHHRPEHVAWQGTCLLADNPWWGSHFTPNGWGCKCWIRQVGRAEYKRLQAEGTPDATAPQILDSEGLPTGRREERRIALKTKAPPTRMMDWLNKRTGEIEKIPVGIDPGWQTNPGAARRAMLNTQLTDKTAAADTALARAAVRSVMASPILDGWLGDREGELGAGVMEKPESEALGVKSQVARLSGGVAYARSLKLDEWRLLPEIFEKGLAIRTAAGTVEYFRHAGGKLYTTTVKAGDKEAPYLSRFTFSTEKALEAERKAGTTLREEAE